jgi:hypothetical protein
VRAHGISISKGTECVEAFARSAEPSVQCVECSWHDCAFNKLKASTDTKEFYNSQVRAFHSHLRPDGGKIVQKLDRHCCCRVCPDLGQDCDHNVVAFHFS